MSKHTKGPWRIYQNPRTETVHIIGYKSDHICVLGPYPYDDEGKANASLIAAAPEMMAILKEIKSDMEIDKPYFREDYNRIKDLISKAEGKNNDCL